MAKTTTRPAAPTPEPVAAEETPAAPAPGPAPAAGPTPGESETAVDGAPEQQGPGVYEYVHGIGCVYPHVPLTCHAHHPAVPATDSGPGSPEQVATVFDWPDGPPPDGRWAKTKKRPTQAADNAGARLTSEE